MTAADQENPSPVQATRGRTRGTSDVASGAAAYSTVTQGAALQPSVTGKYPSYHPSGQSSGHHVGQGYPPAAFDMSQIAGTLPNYQIPQPSFNEHHYNLGGPSRSAGVPHQTEMSHVNAHGYAAPPPQYGSAYQNPIYGPVHGQHLLSSRVPSPTQSGSITSYVPTQSHHQSYMHYPPSYGPLGPGGYAPPFSSALAHGYGQHAMGQTVSQYGGPHAASLPYPYLSSGQHHPRSNTSAASRAGHSRSSGSLPTTPRGPPRKPKQSGHALWVGNLPPGTKVNDLKDHFSRDALKDIESVFLISKSNCAFVNYRAESACAAAMVRFHDSRFQGVRLVCRLRRLSAPSPGHDAPTAPAAFMPSVAQSQTAFESITQNREVSSKAMSTAAAGASQTGDSPSKILDKYFIMKSLTVEDMELSVRNGIWATQGHNEDTLNEAYKRAENVYLIFSANKSGEYFGFARMSSPINDESSAMLDWAPKGETVIEDSDAPRSIPTAATEFAPRGRIIDDSARGTIFWEADPEDEQLAPIIDHEVDNPEIEDVKAQNEFEQNEATNGGDVQAFGKPFRINWIATTRLPFYRTRGLRNPWNANREVKIARDGTEIETSIGRRLVQMFHRSATGDSAQ